MNTKIIEVGDWFEIPPCGVAEVVEIDRKNNRFTLCNDDYDFIASLEELQTEATPVEKPEPKTKIEIHLDDWPSWLPWAAIDRNGDCYLHSEKPILGTRVWRYGADFIEIPGSYFKYEGDWKDSLTERAAATRVQRAKSFARTIEI